MYRLLVTEYNLSFHLSIMKDCNLMAPPLKVHWVSSGNHIYDPSLNIPKNGWIIVLLFKVNDFFWQALTFARQKWNIDGISGLELDFDFSKIQHLLLNDYLSVA